MRRAGDRDLCRKTKKNLKKKMYNTQIKGKWLNEFRFWDHDDLGKRAEGNKEGLFYDILSLDDFMMSFCRLVFGNFLMLFPSVVYPCHPLPCAVFVGYSCKGCKRYKVFSCAY